MASCVFVTQTLDHFHLSSKVNTLTSLSSRLLIQRNISIQLLLFLSNLVRRVLTLGLLHLQCSDLECKLQHLVLDLAVLERSRGFSRCVCDSRVERICFCRFGGFALGLKGFKLGG